MIYSYKNADYVPFQIMSKTFASLVCNRMTGFIRRGIKFGYMKVLAFCAWLLIELFIALNNSHAVHLKQEVNASDIGENIVLQTMHMFCSLCETFAGFNNECSCLIHTVRV